MSVPIDENRVGNGAGLRRKRANRLIDYPTGSVLRVPDDFILSGLRRPPRAGSSVGWLVRLLELCFRKREEFQLLAKHLSIKR